MSVESPMNSAGSEKLKAAVEMSIKIGIDFGTKSAWMKSSAAEIRMNSPEASAMPVAIA